MEDMKKTEKQLRRLHGIGGFGCACCNLWGISRSHQAKKKDSRYVRRKIRQQVLDIQKEG